MKFDEIKSSKEPIMERIRKSGSEWEVTDEAGKKVLGKHPTREKALAQLRAIEANKGLINDLVMVLCISSIFI